MSGDWKYQIRIDLTEKLAESRGTSLAIRH